MIARKLVARHLFIAPDLHPYIFPLYHPYSLDVLLFWDIPSSGRSGHLLISGAIVGAEHGALHDVIREAREAKVKRSIYAETQMERSSILEAIRTSEWNAEMNPVSLTTIEPGVINHNFSETYVSAIIILPKVRLIHTSQIVPRPRDLDVEEFLHESRVEVYSEVSIRNTS
jgi:hypothetical protein